MRTIYLIPVMTILSFCGFNKSFDFKDKNIDQVRYSYHDSSVPPQFQRNYTITVKPDIAQVIVTSYGNLINDSSVVCTQQQFDEIINLLQTGKVRNAELSNNDGCTGGNGESLSCYSKDSLVFSGDVYHCGGTDSGNLKGDIGKASYAICSLFPNFDALLKR
jgi:hypothetical protein